MSSLAYVYHSAFDPSNAHGSQIVHTCNALVARGYDVTLFAAGDVQQFVRANDLETRFRIDTIPLVGTDRLHDRLGYYLYAAARSRPFDLLFTRDISFLRVLRRVPEWWYPPTVYEAHKTYSGIDQLSAADERRRLGAVDAVVAISTGVARDLERIGVNIAAVIPDAAATDLLPNSSIADLRSERNLPASGTVLIYAGSISTWKNDLELVIEGYGALDDREECKLVILGGSDTEIEPLKKTAKTLGMEGDIRFVGKVSQEEVFRYLVAADVGIVPLRADDQIASRYTSPLKLYEYRLCGLEVVASDVPAIVDPVGDDDHVHIYESGSASGFTRAVREAIDANRDDDRTLGSYRYSYERRADQLAEVFAGLTSVSRNERTTPGN